VGGQQPNHLRRYRAVVLPLAVQSHGTQRTQECTSVLADSPSLPRHFYLDTQQWNYFVDRAGWSASELAELRRALVAAVSRLDMAIVASAPLLQEIIGAARRHPGKYESMRDLLFDAIEARWLRPLNERHRAEAIVAGLIPIEHRYMNRKTRRDIEKLARRKVDISWVADTQHDHLNEFKIEQERIRSLARTQLGDEVRLDDANLRRSVSEWWAGVDIASWVKDIVESGRTSGLLPEDGSGIRDVRATYPSVWHFTSYKLARIKLNLGDRRAIQASDYVDAEHYACGAYFDVLVTDDRAVRATSDIIADCPFAVEGFDSFVTRLTSR
jgi:hypothetical protein